MPIFNTYPEVGGSTGEDLFLLWDSTNGRVRTTKANPMRMVPTVEALRDIDVNPAGGAIPDGYTVRVLGYYEPGDGGGFDTYYDSAGTGTDNGGSIIEPNAGNGRWFMNIDGLINVKSFGAKGDNSTDDQPKVQNAINVGSILFPGGWTFVLGSTVTVPSNRLVLMEEPSLLKRASASSHQTAFSVLNATNVRIKGLRYDFNNASQFHRLVDFGNGISSNVEVKECSVFDSSYPYPGLYPSGGDRWMVVLNGNLRNIRIIDNNIVVYTRCIR